MQYFDQLSQGFCTYRLKANGPQTKVKQNSRVLFFVVVFLLP